MNFRGPQAYSNLPEVGSAAPLNRCNERAPLASVTESASPCSQNDFLKNRRLLVDSTSCAGIKSNALRGPRCKPSLQFCIPFDTILVRPYKLSHDESE